MSNEAHDTNERSMLSEYLRDLVYTVAVLREYYHPRATRLLTAVSVLVVKANEMVENDLLEFSELGVTDSERRRLTGSPLRRQTDVWVGVSNIINNNNTGFQRTAALISWEESNRIVM